MVLRAMLKPIQLICASTRLYSNTNGLVSVTMSDKSRIATVSMDRKPINALNYELLKDLNTVLEGLDGTAKGVILTSSLPTVFSGGLDIMDMYKPKQERITAMWSQLQEMWLTLFSTSYPTVAAINGNSPAGGCLLAMSCEYRVMVEKYHIGLNETKLGMVPPFWCVSTMKNIISAREAELALTSGRLFSTEEAHRAGLVDEVAADKEEALAKARAFFKRFEKVHPVARRLTKTSLRSKIVDEFHRRRTEDLKEFQVLVSQPGFQETLGKYIQSLKKKRDN